MRRVQATRRANILPYNAKEGQALQIQIEPCLVVDGKKVSENTIAEHFAKIDEELNELKAAILHECTICNRLEKVIDGVDDNTDTDIGEEAADTITAIMSMLYACGYDQDYIDAACQVVIEKNRDRGRLG